MTEDKLILGSEEWIKLPALGIPFIKARVDSGAKTSAIHAFNIARFDKNGEPWVSFEVHPLQGIRKVVVRSEARLVDYRKVRSSTGVSEDRAVVMTTAVVGNLEIQIEITLANRDAMGFRMLLGREAMVGRVLVDPGSRCCLGDVGKDVIYKAYEESRKVNNGLKIGLLASNPDLYSNRRIMEAGEQRGHSLRFLNIKQCYIKVDAEMPEVHYRGGSLLNDLDAIIPRIKPALTFYGCALTRHFEALNIFTLNSSSSIIKSRDKLFSLQVLLSKGIRMPTTGFANSPVDTDDLIEMVGGAPLIVKLLEGTQGKGVVLGETKKAAESVINAFKSLNANLLVQQFVKEANGRDLRCFVIDGKVVGAIERRAAPGEFRANLHRGGTAFATKITAEEKGLAIKAAKTLHLAVAGVDLIRSNKGPLLLEVNSSPGLEGIEEATGRDIATAMVLAVERAKGWKGPS